MSEGSLSAHELQVKPGVEFGLWTVIEFAGRIRYRDCWNCRCRCGTVAVRQERQLVSGKNGGCAICRNGTRTHGKTLTPEHVAWKAMLQRCYYEKHPQHKDYGGRGIKVCDRWRNSFENFLADMGPKPSPEHSIDREDNDGNYEPDNCRWQTPVDQCNNKRNNVLVTVDGETKTVAQWAAITGLSPFTIYARINSLKWSHHRAVTEPPRH